MRRLAVIKGEGRLYGRMKRSLPIVVSGTRPPGLDTVQSAFPEMRSIVRVEGIDEA